MPVATMEEDCGCHESVLSCCLCRNPLNDPVLLACLHNSCQQCFAEASKTSNGDVECSQCGDITNAGTELPNGLINRVTHSSACATESKACDICKKFQEVSRDAVEWCPSCRRLLCANCIPYHAEFNRNHSTESLQETASLEEKFAESPLAMCVIHSKPLNIACQDCLVLRCLSCFVQCSHNKHEMLVIGEKSFDIYVTKLAAILSSAEMKSERKLEVVDGAENFLSSVKAARTSQLQQIRSRKRRVVEAVEAAYDEIERSLENMYDELETEARNAVAEANRLHSQLESALSYVQRLTTSNNKCEIFRQHKVVGDRLDLLSQKLDALRKALRMKQSVTVETSIPGDLHGVVRSWIGVPVVLDATANTSQPQPQRHLSFGTASANLYLPVNCSDVSLMQDGRLLLAAWEHGLIELCSRGHELSRWRPSKAVNDNGDSVQCVAALTDRRAAAGLVCARLVVILRKCDERVTSRSELPPTSLDTREAWVVERRFDSMECSPQNLSVHGEVLAVSACLTGRLQLMSIKNISCSSSSCRVDQLSTELHREYRIGGIALTARVLVTASGEKVVVGVDRQAYVLDAHDLASKDQRLWRREMSSSDEELVWGVCADASADVLFAAIWTTDLTRNRVSAISLADGSELRSVSLDFHGSDLLPRRLSLSDGGATDSSSGSSGCNNGCSRLLAVLCWEPKTEQQRTITLHTSIDGGAATAIFRNESVNSL